MFKVFTALFGCSHEHCTFPRTVKQGRRPAAAELTGTYVVCLDCGKEFSYDWEQMKVVDGTEAVLVSVEKQTARFAA